MCLEVSDVVWCVFLPDHLEGREGENIHLVMLRVGMRGHNSKVNVISGKLQRNGWKDTGRNLICMLMIVCRDDEYGYSVCASHL